MTESVDELLNHGGDFRTAPATPVMTGFHVLTAYLVRDCQKAVLNIAFHIYRSCFVKGIEICSKKKRKEKKKLSNKLNAVCSSYFF